MQGLEVAPVTLLDLLVYIEASLQIWVLTRRASALAILWSTLGLDILHEREQPRHLA